MADVLSQDSLDDLLERVREAQDHSPHPHVTALLSEVGVVLAQLHQAYVNEAYRNRGFKPWMRSTR